MIESKRKKLKKMESIKQEKKVVYSAIQATGIPSLGNYFGVIKNWNDMQNNYDCVFAVAYDLSKKTVACATIFYCQKKLPK